MSEKFRAASLSELELPAISSAPRWATVRHGLGINAFGVNAWIGDAGQAVITEHDEVGPRSARHEELYVVLSGHATFTVDGEEVDAPTGTLVFVGDPAAKRKAVAVEPETTVLAVGAPAGEAFTPSEWERSAPALGYFATGEYDKAYELLAKAHEEFPDDAHLEQSIAADNVFVELAQKDTDFDPIRDDPRFASLVG